MYCSVLTNIFCPAALKNGTQIPLKNSLRRNFLKELCILIQTVVWRDVISVMFVVCVAYMKLLL